MIRTSRRIRLCNFLLIVMLAIIWGNSMVSGADSGNLSSGIVRWLMALLHIPETAADTVHLLIRKAAHFTEFACLGMLITWRLGMAGEQGIHLAALAVFGGMSAACIDETIQVFSPDRGPSLIDVWIDVSGVAAGMTVLLLGHALLQKRTKNTLEETT